MTLPEGGALVMWPISATEAIALEQRTLVDLLAAPISIFWC